MSSTPTIQAASALTVSPIQGPLQGEFNAPAEAQSSRLALVAALLCHEPLVLRGTLAAPGVAVLLDALPKLGVKVKPEEDGLRLKPPRQGTVTDAVNPLRQDCGEQAESALLLAALCAGLGQPAELTLTTSAALEAGLVESIEALSELGAAISFEPGAELGLLRVEPSQIRVAKLEVPNLPGLNGALLLCALAAGTELTLREAKHAQDHPYRLLRALGAEIYHSSEGATLPAEQRLHGGELKLPGCPQAALARLLPALLIPGSSMQVLQCSLNPRRAAALKLLHECAPAQREGAPGLYRPRTWQFGYEPVAALSAVYSQRIRGFTVLPNRALLLSEDLPWILLLATQARGPVLLRGYDRLLESGPEPAAAANSGAGIPSVAARLRYVAEVLRSFGVDAELESDGWRISGPATLQGAELQCAADPLVTRLALLLARFATGPSLLFAAAPLPDPLAWAFALREPLEA